MSDVEKWIEPWRIDLANGETLGDSDIRELESHLREEMEHLKVLPLSDEEAFLVARHRLGDTAALEREFRKINPHGRLRQRLSWGIMGVLLYFAVITFAHAASILSVRFVLMGGWHGYGRYVGQLEGFVRIAAFVGALIALWLYARHLSRRSASRSRDATAAPTLAAAVLAVGTVAFVAVRILATQMVWRGVTIDPRMMYRYTELEFQVAASVLLAGSFIVLHRRSRREVQSQP
ncbi:MAG: hypothetical protein JW955_18755 [Sedimentisphaerales bacterium]|nr:hypothetical protein [Sedimentisphaerales bacterium]